jgi:hypothetical protein
MPAVLRSSVGVRQNAAGALHRETHLVQQLPHVSRMVGDAEFLRNHPGEHRRSPDSRVQTVGHRATFEDIPELGALLRSQTRWPARSVALQQPIHAVSLIRDGHSDTLDLGAFRIQANSPLVRPSELKTTACSRFATR